MAKELYSEQQQFNQPLLWIMIGLGVIPIVGILIDGVHQQIILGQPWGDTPMSDLGLLLVTVFCLVFIVLIVLLFRFAKLETRVDRWGVHYKYAPLIPKWKTLDKTSIMEYRNVKYSFRGYGIRWGLDGVKTINVKGNMGIEFLYGKNKKLIIGTQLPDDFLAALDKMKNPELE